ncbi:hypothetical protein [Nitrososphaera sp.]|uniref:hypothetical protein n=1 Tax=Nitrososphaera sp. TaxID=1971748 RepID=UPI00307D7F91
MVQKVWPAAFASDAEVNIVAVTVACPDGSVSTINKAYREEAARVRELVCKVFTFVKTGG